MFAKLPHNIVPVDALSEEERTRPICDTLMKSIGKEVVRTELKYHPAILERIDYVATTYACPECHDSLEPTFAKDFVKEPLVPHSYVSSGLAAHVMYAKFINALPYYRQEKDFLNQFGVRINRGTMAHRTIYCARNYFKTVTDYLGRLRHQRRFIASDETPIQVLKEEGVVPRQNLMSGCFVPGRMENRSSCFSIIPQETEMLRQNFSGILHPKSTLWWMVTPDITS